jgi:very-short-patch-repair endonuclease
MSRSPFVAPGVVLDAHQADRDMGAPVVSVIAGSRDQGRPSFVGWCGGRRLGHVVPAKPTVLSAVQAVRFAGVGSATLFVPDESDLRAALAEAFVLAQRYPRMPVALLVPAEAIGGVLAETGAPLPQPMRARIVGGLVASDPVALNTLETDGLKTDETPLYRSDHEQVLHLLLRHDADISSLFRVNQKVRVGRFRGYEVDFWCERLRLAIEIDGLQHEQQAQRRRDADRDKALAAAGVRSYRIRAGMVMRDPSMVLNWVRRVVQQRTRELSA